MGGRRRTHVRGEWVGIPRVCEFTHVVSDTRSSLLHGGVNLRVGVQAFYCSESDVDSCPTGDRTYDEAGLDIYVEQIIP